MRKTLAVQLLFPLVFFTALPAFARAETILNEEFWAEIEPLVPKDGEAADADAAILAILEEARYVFSGMIFGFTFSYTPLDRSRAITEEFTLEPTFQIPKGDPALFVHQTRREGSRLYARLRYRLAAFQEDWYTATLSNTLRASSGSGQGSLFEGYSEKITAIRNSVKSAVREHARSRIDNKPLKVKGTVFLNAAPRIEITSGAFRALSSVRLRIDEVLPYNVH